MPTRDAIAGLHVFVAEDQFLVLQMIEDMLAELGCVVADAVSSAAAALDRARTTQAQVAILDVNLRGSPVFPAARILQARGVPIVFATGYGLAGIEAEWKTWPILQKPFATGELASALARIAPRQR